MIDGNVNDFLEAITYQEAYMLFRSQKYLFYGAIWYPEQEVYYFAIDLLYDQPINNIYGESVFETTAKTIPECITAFLSAPIFAGNSFYEIEKELTWIDF